MLRQSSSYTVSKNTAGKTIVQDSRGRTLTSSSSSSTAIQYAIDRTSNGGIVLIKEGTYTLSGLLKAKAGVTISGAGAGTVLNNGEIDVYVSNVVITSLKMTGTCHILITPTTADISNIIVQDVSATVGTIEAANSVITNNYKVSGVKFIRDTVTNSGASGFMLSGSAMISDITFDSCKVIGSGQSTRFNDWVSGFILAQNAVVKNINVVKCEASSNWENGFFLKPSVTKTNVVLQDCIANSNGQKPTAQEGYGYLLDATVSLVDSTGTGNKGGLTNLATLPAPVTKGTSNIVLSTTSSVQVGTNRSHHRHSEWRQLLEHVRNRGRLGQPDRFDARWSGRQPDPDRDHHHRCQRNIRHGLRSDPGWYLFVRDDLRREHGL